MPKTNINKHDISERKCSLKELRYYNLRGSLVMLHGQFNNSTISTRPSKNDLDKLASLNELSLFKLNTNLDSNLNPFQNLSCNQIHRRYFSPHSFEQMKTKLLRVAIDLAVFLSLTITS